MRTPHNNPDMGDTTIRVSEELAEELYQRKGRSTSYEDYIWELLETIDEKEEEVEDSEGAWNWLEETPE